MCLLRSEDNFGELVLSYYHVVSSQGSKLMSADLVARPVSAEPSSQTLFYLHQLQFLNVLCFIIVLLLNYPHFDSLWTQRNTYHVCKYFHFTLFVFGFPFFLCPFGFSKTFYDSFFLPFSLSLSLSFSFLNSFTYFFVVSFCFSFLQYWGSILGILLRMIFGETFISCLCFF